LWQLNLAQCSEGLKNKDFSVTELTEACLKRLTETEPAIKSCLAVLEDQALETARDLDRRGNDSSRLLWGLPLTVKDVFCLKGAPTTAGSRQLSDYYSVFEATVVRRLKAHGAIILAKTNCDEFAMGSSTEFSAFGPTRNPWDRQRVPGGSSGGAAASVAGFQVPGAFGTDTGGSIRQPAALCGCVGLKPTYGRVSRYGIIAYGSSFDQAGPLARTAADCGRLLQAVAGPDAYDATLADCPVPDFVNQRPLKPNELTLGLPRQFWNADLHPQVAKVLDEARNLLTKAGLNLIEVDLPNIKYAVAAYYILASAEASTNLARYDGVRYGFRQPDPGDLMELYTKTRQTGLGPEARRRILLGTFVLSSGYYEAYYRKAAQVRRLIKNDIEAALTRCHFLLAPVSAIPAWPLGSFLDDPLTVYQMDLMTLPLNLYGGPGLSVPAGLGDDNLPVGAQLWGKPMSEASLISAGRVLESLWPKLPEPQIPVI
jgi:aspartyl-tRNA(Asn)/glutamyl-tRNA(Gln) amidotransferase subunit A